MQINGRVYPIDLLAASNVKIIRIEPIITSVLDGFPTRLANISGGNNGK